MLLLLIALRNKIFFVVQKAFERFGDACESIRAEIVKGWTFIHEWKDQGADISSLFANGALPFWVVAGASALFLAVVLQWVLISCCKLCKKYREGMGDEPISSSRDDKLERMPYVKSLCKIIKSWGGVDSQVIGIYGEWGEGKTSVINLFDELYCRGRRREFDLVRFYPWHSVDRKNINSELFGCIGSQLGIFHNPALSLKFMFYARKTVSRFMSGVDSLSELAISVFTWLLFPSSSREHLKKCISDELQKKKRRLIVVLDDVDRLSKKEVLELVRCLKTNADFPNTTYFLLSDANRLADMLKGEIGSEEKGDRYLEKIVQCPYPLWPIGAETLRGEAIAILNGVLKAYNNPVGTDLADALDFCLEKTKNLRQIKRVVYAFNESLAYYYSMLSEDADFADKAPLDIELGDALRLAALRVIEPGCIARLYKFYEKYVRMGSAIAEVNYMVDRDEYEKLCKAIKDENMAWFKKFLHETMMLELESSEGQSIIRASGIREDAEYTGFRLASPKNFRRYFNSAEIPRGLVPRRDRLELLSAMRDEGRIRDVTIAAHGKSRLFNILEAIIANNDYVAIDELGLRLVKAADYIVNNLEMYEAYEDGARYRLAYDTCQLAVENIIRQMGERLLSVDIENNMADWIIEKKSYVLGLFILHYCAAQLEPTIQHQIDKTNGVMVDKIWAWIKGDLSCRIFDEDIEDRKDSALIQKFYMMIVLEKLPVDLPTFKNNCGYFITSMNSPLFAKRLNSLVTYSWRPLREEADKTRRNLTSDHVHFFIKVLTAAEKFILNHQDDVSVGDLKFIQEMGRGYQTETAAEISKLFRLRLGE